MALNSEEERFRSFAERYVIERSVNFRPGYEQEDAWAAMLDAKSIYTQIRGLGAAQFGVSQDTAAQGPQGASGPPSPNPGGALGASGARGMAAPGTPTKGPRGGSAIRREPNPFVPTGADALQALAAAKTAPKRGSLAKLKAAAMRLGKHPKP